jgi:hypothetical protein
VDVSLVGLPVYLLDLDAPLWLPGVVLAAHTALTSTCGTLAVRVTDGRPRTWTLALGAWLAAGWCGLVVAAAALPEEWRTAWFLASVPVMAASALFFGARVNALAVALAPAAARGRHLAAFQYAYTVPGVVAPAVVALFAVEPWAVVAVCAATGALAFRWLGTRLPADALTTGSR